ncbi:hypothetical protein KSB_45540 [Ktedonobacter robiniae]|uniref:Uncharacterized protein n=1 Tax=Ktedonobacter robiniae TaxID=2778365 RepID=A0ABQ3UTR0_9CHLR|nr:hypothetical protein KSB_45540 [Ktedonobacter robiniae]
MYLYSISSEYRFMLLGLTITKLLQNQGKLKTNMLFGQYIAHKALSKDPHQRYAYVKTFAMALVQAWMLSKSLQARI